MSEPEKIDIPEKRTNKVVPIPRENPLRMISVLFHESVGKLPAHLVVLFVVAAIAAVSVGMFMKIETAGKAEDSKAYLDRRIEVDSSQPALTEQPLRGVWAMETDEYVATLRIGGGIFELVSRPKEDSINRYFIRGGYRLEGDLLILQVRPDLGSPLDSDHQEYKYMPIAFKEMNAHVLIRSNMMAWNVPESEKKRVKNNDPALAAFLGGSSPWVKLSSTP